MHYLPIITLKEVISNSQHPSISTYLVDFLNFTIFSLTSFWMFPLFFVSLKIFIFHFLQMTSNDKDFRFMATNDLMSELQKDSIKLDDESEKKVVKAVLRLLEDKNGEVQNLAVKW